MLDYILQAVQISYFLALFGLHNATSDAQFDFLLPVCLPGQEHMFQTPKHILQTHALVNIDHLVRNNLGISILTTSGISIVHCSHICVSQQINDTACTPRFSVLSCQTAIAWGVGTHWGVISSLPTLLHSLAILACYISSS